MAHRQLPHRRALHVGNKYYQWKTIVTYYPRQQFFSSWFVSSKWHIFVRKIYRWCFRRTVANITDALPTVFFLLVRPTYTNKAIFWFVLFLKLCLLRSLCWYPIGKVFFNILYNTKTNLKLPKM